MRNPHTDSCSIFSCISFSLRIFTHFWIFHSWIKALEMFSITFFHRVLPLLLFWMNPGLDWMNVYGKQSPHFQKCTNPFKKCKFFFAHMAEVAQNRKLVHELSYTKSYVMLLLTGHQLKLVKWHFEKFDKCKFPFYSNQYPTFIEAYLFYFLLACVVWKLQQPIPIWMSWITIS